MQITPETKPISELFPIESNLTHVIPAYQRNYSWTDSNIETLVDDIIHESKGYYMGNLLVQQRADDNNSYDVVDGQQRLTTISLIFLAIYQRLSDLQKTLNNQNPTEAAQLEDIITLKSNIKRKLMYDGKPRLTLLHRDAEVYESFLAIINKEEPKKYGSRAFAKRYKSILGLLNDPEGIHSIEDIKSFYDRLNAAEMLRISVGDTADAFAVFSSLNSKGVPLTLIDLLKTEYLQRATQAGMTTDGAQSKWEELTDIFTGEGNEPNSTAITQFLLNLNFQVKCNDDNESLIVV